MHATFVLYWWDILWRENCFTKLRGFSVYFRSIPVLWYLVMQMGSWLYGNGKTPEYTPGSKSMTQCVLVACGYPTRLQKWSHADGTVQSNSGINHTTILVLNCLSLFFGVVNLSFLSFLKSWLPLSISAPSILLTFVAWATCTLWWVHVFNTAPIIIRQRGSVLYLGMATENLNLP